MISQFSQSAIQMVQFLLDADSSKQTQRSGNLLRPKSNPPVAAGKASSWSTNVQQTLKIHRAIEKLLSKINRFEKDSKIMVLAQKEAIFGQDADLKRGQVSLLIPPSPSSYFNVL